jgi:nucleoside-diphosphate-sugar epimerase
MTVEKHAVVLGARSLIGPYLVGRLVDLGYTIECITRHGEETAPSPGLRWTMLDARAPGDWAPRRDAVVFSLLPLWLLSPVLPNLRPARQIVAFGSTSATVKATSPDPGERDLAQNLQTAERVLAESCGRINIPWTLMRPTLVYGGGRDRNISAIAGFIRRFGFFPLAAPGRGLRQPVHADDLAGAALSAVDNPAARDTGFDLPGGETLTYRELVVRIFETLNRRAVILPLPELVLAAAVGGAHRLGLLGVTAETVRRINRDLTFDGAPARSCLDYAPRGFAPELPAER